MGEDPARNGTNTKPTFWPQNYSIGIEKTNFSTEKCVLQKSHFVMILYAENIPLVFLVSRLSGVFTKKSLI